jgi:hypothetical protein
LLPNRVIVRYTNTIEKIADLLLSYLARYIISSHIETNCSGTSLGEKTMASHYNHHIYLVLSLLLFLLITQLTSNSWAQAQTNYADCASVTGISTGECQTISDTYSGQSLAVCVPHPLVNIVNSVTDNISREVNTLPNMAPAGTTSRVSVASNGSQGNRPTTIRITHHVASIKNLTLAPHYQQL